METKEAMGQQYLFEAMEQHRIHLAHLKGVLRDYNLQDVIEVCGESDLMDAIGVGHVAEYLEGVALGGSREAPLAKTCIRSINSAVLHNKPSLSRRYAAQEEE